MDTAEHLTRLRDQAASFSSALTEAVASGHIGSTVPTCPEWTVRQLAEHVGGIYRWSTRLVAESIVVETWRSKMAIEHPTNDDEVVAWFSDSATAMITAFSAAPTDRRVWVWGADPHARFWPRRMLHETVVHQADLQWTLGREPVIDAATAVDGMDEFLTNLPHTARWGAPLDRLRGDREKIVFRAADTGDTWRVRLDPTGFWWDRGGEPADATVTATAADLYLLVQGRHRPAAVVSGRAELLERWNVALDF